MKANNRKSKKRNSSATTITTTAAATTTATTKAQIEKRNRTCLFSLEAFCNKVYPREEVNAIIRFFD